MHYDVKSWTSHNQVKLTKMFMKCPAVCVQLFQNLSLSINMSTLHLLDKNICL